MLERSGKGDQEAEAEGSENVDPEFLINGELTFWPCRRRKMRPCLGRLIFGDKEDSELLNTMISPGKDQESTRSSCCGTKKSIFAKVVKKNIPRVHKLPMQLRVKLPTKWEESFV